MQTLTFNGTTLETPAKTVDQLLKLSGIEARGIAVALNGTVVPRSEWMDTEISTGDIVEVVTAAAGG